MPRHRQASLCAFAGTLLAVCELVFDDEGMNRGAVAPVLDGLARRVRPVTLARDRRVAVGAPLDALLPEGLARGTVVAVGARPGVVGATSLALTLVAGLSGEGVWAAVVGAPWLGLVAAAEIGVALERLVVVDVGGHGPGGGGAGGGRDGAPAGGGGGGRVVGARSGGGGPDGRRGHLASVVAAMVDGFDVVLVGPSVGRQLRAADSRRLAARGRERGGVLVTLGHGLPGGAAQVRLEVTASTWEGLEADGGGHLHRCRAAVEATGRGAASRPRRADLLLRGVAQPEAMVIAEPRSRLLWSGADHDRLNLSSPITIASGSGTGPEPMGA